MSDEPDQRQQHVFDLAAIMKGESAPLDYLANSADDVDLGNRFQSIIEELGYAHFMYSLIDQVAERLYLICCTYPDEIRTAWAESEVYWRDPIISHLVKSITPTSRAVIQDDLSWSDDLAAKLANHGIMTPAWQFVVRDGSPYLGLFTVTSKIAEHRARGDAHYRATELILPALCVQSHETWQRLTKLDANNAPELSRREKEILAWLSHGKSTEDIAEILEITERTVNYHVSNLKQKMQVETRAHAVAQGMRLHII